MRVVVPFADVDALFHRDRASAQRVVRAYDVEAEAAHVAYRGSFLIDKEGIVRHHAINDLPLGRNMDELLKMQRNRTLASHSR